VVVNETLDVHLDYVDASPPPSGFSGGNPYWNIDPLDPDDSGQIVLQAQVETPLPNNTIITNTASIDCAETDPASAQEETTVRSAPVLSLTKSDEPDPVEAGAELVYTLVYTNTGNETATGVVVTDELDSQVTFVDADPPAQGTGRTRYWSIDELLPDDPGQIIVTATVASPLPNGTTLVNTARLDSDQTSTLSIVEETTVHSSPVLTITKTHEPDPVTAGEILYYTIVITNSGNENATSVTVVEDYDTNVSFLSATPSPDPGTGNRRWTFGTLDADDSQTIDIVVRVASPLPVGTVLTNEATLDSAQTSPIAVTETTQVLSESDLRVTQTDGPDPVDAGGILTYSISYSNLGTAPATGVVITNTYDTNVTFISAAPPPDEGDTVWHIGYLNADSSGNIVVQVDVDTPLPNDTTLVNTVTIDSDDTTPASFITTTQVASAPAVTFTVSDQPDPVEAGAVLTYTLRYTNTGNADATGVVVRARPDDNASFSEADPEPTDIVGVVWVWEIGQIAGEGGQGEIVVSADVTLPLPNETILDFTSQLTDEEGDDLRASTETTVTSAPVLSFAKSDGVSTVYAGDTITYTLTYTNSGNENAYDLAIADSLPTSYVEYIGCQIGNGTCQHLPDDDLVVFNIPVLYAPTSSQALVILQVDDPLPAGADLITNRAGMTGPALPTPLETEDVDVIGTLPDLTVTAVHEPSLFSPGGLMTYTVTYGNAGHMHAEDVVISTTLPLSTTYIGYDWSASTGRVYTQAVGDLPAGVVGNTVTFTVRYTDSEQIDAPDFSTPFTVTETGSAGGDANPDDNSYDPRIGVPDLVVIDFMVEPLPLEANAPVTFTVVLENQGTGWAWNPGTEPPSAFCVDIFTAPIPSYPWQGYSEIDVWDYAPPIEPGMQHTLTLTYDGFTELEILQLDGFYVKADNHEQDPYGLVPERNERNNVAGPIIPWLNYIYLPLVLR
jgi:uncharacterized repeat protein (TIGR01451 family)